jgi:hypothetical protein
MAQRPATQHQNPQPANTQPANTQPPNTQPLNTQPPNTQTQAGAIEALYEETFVAFERPHSCLAGLESFASSLEARFSQNAEDTISKLQAVETSFKIVDQQFEPFDRILASLDSRSAALEALAPKNPTSARPPDDEEKPSYPPPTQLPNYHFAQLLYHPTTQLGAFPTT